LKINEESKDGAIKENNIEMIRLLIKFANENKIILNLNEKYEYGETQLIIACIKRNKELVKCLLQYREIDVNVKTEYHLNALMIACILEDKDIVDCIIGHKNVDVKIMDNKNNFALHIACYLNNIEIVRSLVKKENLYNVFNDFNDTPLDIAEEYKNEEMISCLYGNENRVELETEDDNTKELISAINQNNCSNSKIVPIEDVERSIYLIKNGEFSGTGFFITIPIPSKENPMRGLMTNNHVLNENNLKSGESFEIYKYSENNEPIQIQINDDNFVFTSELIDVTFIELSNEMINEIDPIFLYPRNMDNSINKSILIVQFPEKKFSIAHGNIKEIHGYNIYHEISTNFGSSGSPLLDTNNEVVGVHKSGIKGKEKEMNVNAAVKYSEIEFAIRTLYDNKDVYGIGKAKLSAKLLSENEMEVLNEYGLKLKLSSDDFYELKKDIIESNENEKIKIIKLNELEIVQKSLFYCTFSEKFLFYRTNYVWYVTCLPEKENNIISRFNLDNLKCLNWSPLISNSKDISIDSKINGKEFTLITWLKLTGLKYV